MTRLYAYLAAVALALGAIGVQTVRLAYAHTELANERTERAVERQNAAVYSQLLEAHYREEEERRHIAHQEIERASAQRTQAALADARAAATARDRLLLRVEALVAAAREAASHPGPAALGAPAGDPIGVLADVLRGVDERAGILAEYADQARIAGLACERSYDALTK